jgi:hypothetical protein
MSDSDLKKYLARDNRQTAKGEPIDDLGRFGILRGPRERSPSIELRKANGKVLALGYHTIDDMEFDPTDGITLKAGKRTIRLKGRNLGRELRPNIPLITALATHRLAWVQEVGKTDQLTAPKDQPMVELIDW